VGVHFLQQKCLILREHCLSYGVYSLLGIHLKVFGIVQRGLNSLVLSVYLHRSESLDSVEERRFQKTKFGFKTIRNKSQKLPLKSMPAQLDK